MSEGKNKGGQPPKYKSVKELQSAIDDYFNNPPTVDMVVGGVLEKIPTITITGLALHLGFESRQSFYDYKKIGRYSYTMKRARMRIENAYEQKLHFNNVTGPIFALKNLGWTDKPEADKNQVEAQPLNISFNVAEPVGEIKVTNGSKP